jgi:pyridoxal phosphate enzyme (YggS family)
MGAGIKDFGENRVQDLLIKQAAFPGARWHMIGHLQTNKVRDVIGSACLIHSLDRWPLAEYIEKKAENTNMEVPVLVQVNVSGESSKGGVRVPDLMSFISSVDQLRHLKIQGLMTMAPEEDEAEKARPVFKELKHLFDVIKKGNYRSVEMNYLSMGMTQDYEVAIEEGANIIRVGRAVFGPRG